MSEIIDHIKQNSEFKQSLSKELVELGKESIASKAQLTPVYLGQLRAWQKAGQIMADDIYELTEDNENLQIENKGLRHQLGTYLNDDQLKKYCRDEKVKLGTDTDRNKRILDRLNKRVIESDKQLKYSSPALALNSAESHTALEIAKKK